MFVLLFLCLFQELLHFLHYLVRDTYHIVIQGIEFDCETVPRPSPLGYSGWLRLATLDPLEFTLLAASPYIIELAFHRPSGAVFGIYSGVRDPSPIWKAEHLWLFEPDGPFPLLQFDNGVREIIPDPRLEDFLEAPQVPT